MFPWARGKKGGSKTIKRYKTQEEFEAEVKNGVFTSKEGIDIIVFVLITDIRIEVDGDIMGRNIYVLGKIIARNIGVWNIFAQDIRARNIGVKNIDAQFIKAWDIDARSVNTENMVAQNICVKSIKAGGLYLQASQRR